MLFRIVVIEHRPNITVEKENFVYLTKVLRLHKNDSFEAVNGTEKISIYQIIEIRKNSLTAALVKNYQENNEPKRDLTLIQALPKADKIEYILQKCTELGVKNFLIYEADRSPVKLKNFEKKLERFNSIVHSAVCQSHRDHLPQINYQTSLGNSLKHLQDLKLFTADISSRESIGEIKEKRLGLIIGPEAGFSDKELALLNEKTDILSFGKTILRTETAAVAASARILL